MRGVTTLHVVLAGDGQKTVEFPHYATEVSVCTTDTTNPVWFRFVEAGALVRLPATSFTRIFSDGIAKRIYLKGTASDIVDLILAFHIDDAEAKTFQAPVAPGITQARSGLPGYQMATPS